MLFRRAQYRVFTLFGTNADYLSAVGDGTGSSTVTAPLFWVARTFPEAPPALWRQLGNGQEQQVLDHPMLRLLRFPNPVYTGVEMWMATVIDYQVDGNAFWLKVRNGAGRVEQLWWVPHWTMQPVGTERELVTGYVYTPDGVPVMVKPEDVVHFQFGIDSDDIRRGKSPLKSVLREVFTDDEAAQFTVTILKNMGVPGLMVSPKDGLNITKEQGLELKAEIQADMSGDNRGSTTVMLGPTDIQQFGFSPEQLLLRELRRIPEERVTAVMGIPAIVAGLGAGLDRSTFTNMGEAREAAYEAGIIPMQRALSEKILSKLLADFEPDVFVWRFGFDLSKVRVLQEDLFRQAQRLDLGVRGGWVRRSEARRHLGFEVGEQDDVYLMPLNVAAVAANEPPPLTEDLNGNTNGSAADIAEELSRRMQLTAG